MNRITVDQLRKAKACTPQVALFRKLFGDSVDVTVEAAIAVADTFDFSWAARNLLSPSALQAYHQAFDPAWQAYKQAQALAWQAWQDDATTLRAYEQDRTLAQQAYEQADAIAFVEAYRSM